MATSVELRQQHAALWERAKEINDATEAENRGFTTEENTNWEKLNADMKVLAERIERQEIMERTPAPAENRRLEIVTPEGPRLNVRELPEYRDSFNRWMTMGELTMDDHRLLREARAIGVGSQTGVGYLAPSEYERTIRQNMLAFGGMREAATIMTTANGNDLEMPTSDDTGNTGELVAEHASVAEQDVTVGIRVLKAYKYSSRMVRVSVELLQDSAFDVESWLSGLLAERIARITNTHFTLGTGSNQPTGIALSAASGITGAAGTATSVLWDDLIRLEHTVDPAYRNGARYMFADSTLSQLRRVKDGDGNYIWQAGTTVGAPGLINGWPYTINQDVPAFAANAVSIYFGQLSKYIIRDVLGFSVVRLDEAYATSGQVAFLGFARFDGLLVHAGTNPVQTWTNGAS